VTDNLLRYKFLNNWDKAMQALGNLRILQIESKFKWLSHPEGTFVSLKHELDKIIAFERGNLLWIFNFHPTKSFSDYRIGTRWKGKYKIVLNSDSKDFGGHDRLNESTDFFSNPEPWCDRDNFIQVYIPCRTCIVLEVFEST
jgi:1,4-alpha-glucan branching enzyme